MSAELAGLRVTARFFGIYRELAKGGERSLTLPPGSTVGDLVAALRECPDLGFIPERPVVAVNHAYADPGLVLDEEDEVALIPPVAGG